MINDVNCNLAFYGTYLLLQYDDIWQFVYSSMISFNKNIKKKKKTYCLYLDKSIKNLSVKNLNRDMAAFILHFNSLFDLNKNNLEIYKKQIYFFIYAIVNDSHNDNIRFMKKVITNVFDLVSGRANETELNNLYNKTIKYPSIEIIDFVVTFYKDIILPYENYIRRNDINHIEERIIYLYVQMISCIPIHCSNIFMIVKIKNNEFSKESQLYK